MFRLSNKSLVMKKRSDALWFVCIFPAILLAGALMMIVIAGDLVSPDNTHIPSQWLPLAVSGARVLTASLGLFFLYLFAAWLGQLKHDGYLEAIFQHSEKLKAEREVAKTNA